jgi:hypothetical protein
MIELGKPGAMIELAAEQARHAMIEFPAERE